MTTTQRRPADRVVRSKVEPRLQERRVRVAEDRRRRRKRSWAVMGGVAAALAVAVAVAYSPLLDLDHLRIEGVTQLDADRLAEASGLTVGDQMVQIDVAAVRDAVRAVPGVRSVRVHREWPSTVRVVVGEEQPAVELRSGERRAVLSTTGHLLEPGVLAAELVPLEVTDEDLELTDGDLESAVVSEEVLDAAMVLHRMEPRLRAEVASATLGKGALLSFELSDGARVRFGPLENVPAKLGALEAVLTQVAPDCRGSIDVREPARATVSRTCPGPPVSDGSGVDEGEVVG